MLRSFLIRLSKAEWARKLLMDWGLARSAARRFVAGETADEALQAVQELNRQGILATLDQLGENTATPADARQTADEIQTILDRIAQAGAHANVSLKLSQIGLLVDRGSCQENLARILEHARGCQNFVRIDMEDSAVTSQTLDLYRAMRQAGFDNVGVVLQAYLRRTEADLQTLLPLETRVRLCKGAYNEPAGVAFPSKADVDANYDRLACLVLDHAAASPADPLRSDAGSDGFFPPRPAFATHDPQRIAHATAYADSLRLPKDAFEFQMLYGIRRDLQTGLVARGYAVRIYVPYGTHWYPYLMRRLAERPANLWFMLSNALRR
jgi:proline dehydrogenase